MNATAMRRALDGVAAQTRHPGPTAAQWIEALAIVAETTPVPGQWRHLTLTVGGAAHVELRPFKARR